MANFFQTKKTVNYIYRSFRAACNTLIVNNSNLIALEIGFYLKKPWKVMTMKDALRKLGKVDIDKLSDKQLVKNLLKRFQNL